MPNHGAWRGYHIHPVVTNRWDLVRTSSGGRSSGALCGWSTAPSRPGTSCAGPLKHFRVAPEAAVASMTAMKSEIRDNMRIDWDAPIAMNDSVVLRADVFRPVADGKRPVVLSYGPYAKGLAFQKAYKGNWARLIKSAPEVLQGSSNEYQNWELIDPEKWVPDGYVCLRVNSRGAGRSPGFLDVWSPRETQDLYECVEWAGTRSLE